MIIINTDKEIEILRSCGKRLAFILQELAKAIKPGVTGEEINNLAFKLVAEEGDEAAFYNYRPSGADRPFPSALCFSVNDEVVHGIPDEADKILKEGDIVKLDMGLKRQGLITDAAITVPVGKISAVDQKLIEVTEKSLYQGIKAIKEGNKVGDISYAIERTIRPMGFGIVEELCGHGVGHKVHEDPYIPNYGEKNTGPILKAGMVLALEPIVNIGTEKVEIAVDGYTYKTVDGANSAHFEHSILVTKNGHEILTKI